MRYQRKMPPPIQAFQVIAGDLPPTELAFFVAEGTIDPCMMQIRNDKGEWMQFNSTDYIILNKDSQLRVMSAEPFEAMYEEIV